MSEREPWKADAETWRGDGWIDPVDAEIAEYVRAKVAEAVGSWTDALRENLRWCGPIVYGQRYADGDVVSAEVEGRSFLLIWVEGKPRVMAIGGAP